MISLMHNLCLFILTLAIKGSSGTRKFECGEHGRFEYCIDEIPGCVVGCDCDPGYYFDANSKICEPNSKLWSRRRLSNSNRKRKQKRKKSKKKLISNSEEDVVESFSKVADHASKLSDWISNTFFSEIEKQAEKESKTKCSSKTAKKQRKKTHRGRKKKSKLYNSSNNIYFRATSEEKKPNMHSDEEKDGSATKEIGQGEENSTSEEFDDANALNKEIGPGESEETEEKSEYISGEQDHKNHDHRHVLVLKKPKPKKIPIGPPISLMPSFIFLPSLDTPYYPPAPVGLPGPPVVPMYPAVPVPPVPPIYPVPVPHTDNEKECEVIFIKTRQSTTESTTKKAARPKIKEKIQKQTTEQTPTTTATLEPRTLNESKTATTIETTSSSNTKTTETKSIKKSNSTSDTILQSTEAKLESTTETTLLTTIATTPLNTSTIIATEWVNNSNFRRAYNNNHDNYEFLKDINSSILPNGRKGLNNHRIKRIQLNNRILKNSESQGNLVRWPLNNSRESLILNDINVPLGALTTASHQKVNDKSRPQINNFNNNYISDHIHKPSLINDHIKYLGLHPLNNIKKYSTDAAQFNEKYYDSISDPQNVDHTNVEKQIASSLLSETNFIAPTTPISNANSPDRNKDLLLSLENEVIQNTPNGITFLMGGPIKLSIKSRNNVAEAMQNNMTPNINALIDKNAYRPEEKINNIDIIIPHEHIINAHIKKKEDTIHRIPSWDSSNIGLYKSYKNNQAINSNVPKPKQFLQHKRINSKGTKNGFLSNHNPLGMDNFERTTRLPERSYIGRTFFSGDIM